MLFRTIGILFLENEGLLKKHEKNNGKEEVIKMRPFLILTKNVLFEQKLQNRLQCLGYEVFCSKILLEKMQHKIEIEQIDKDFDGLIFSETISDNEAEEIFSDLHRIKHFFRKVPSEPTEEEQESLNAIGYCGWLSDVQSLDQVRETLVFGLSDLIQQEQNQTLVFAQNGDLRQEKVQDIYRGLSHKERDFFQKLLEASGRMVSRSEMSQVLWNEAPNGSHLAQMSVIAKKIRLKLKEMGIEDDILETVWGKGYRLINGQLDAEAV